MDKIWHHIHIIFEQKELIEKCIVAIKKENWELGNMPITAPKIIKFLNSKTSYELKEFDVQEKIATILEVKKVLTKRNLVRKLEEKCHELDMAISRFLNKIEPLVAK